MNNFVKHSIIRFVKEELTTVLDETLSSTCNFSKVRTRFSDDSFDVTRVDEKIEGSIHILIHRIMYLEKHYLRFLDSEMMNEVEEDPLSKWWIESDHKDYDKIDEFLSDIYYDCIVHVYEYLTDKVGHDVKEEFKDYLDL
jgi:hypothetical protein